MSSASTSAPPASDDEAGSGPTRRALLLSTGAAAVVALGGCATYDQNTPAAAPPTSDDSDEPGPDETEAAPKPLAQTSDIPVGGGKVIDNKRVVVTQPQKGTFKCFTAVCTHQGCVVATVENGTINCPCHGSKFKVADGSVATGPATRPLRAVDIKVTGTDITLA